MTTAMHTIQQVGDGVKEGVAPIHYIDAGIKNGTMRGFKFSGSGRDFKTMLNELSCYLDEQLNRAPMS